MLAPPVVLLPRSLQCSGTDRRVDAASGVMSAPSPMAVLELPSTLLEALLTDSRIEVAVVLFNSRAESHRRVSTAGGVATERDQRGRRVEPSPVVLPNSAA